MDICYLGSVELILLVHSSRDIAGVNIANCVLANYSFIKTDEVYQETPVYKAEFNYQKVTFISLHEEAVNAQQLPQDFPEARLIVFLSRHSSQSGKPTLSVHTPGNFAAAELGGLPKTISVAPAVAMQTALKTMMRYKAQRSLLFDYQVSYECTHHGPSLNVPTMFVELGSSPVQWSDTQAAEVVAHSAMAAVVNSVESSSSVAVLGIGGTHYNQKFTTMALVGAASFGHMIPKYAISNIDASMIRQCVERTQERVALALLDWKGIRSEDRPGLLVALKTAGLPYQRV